MNDKKLKIALVGPTYPYRGGISQYTTQLHRALKKTNPLVTISFKRQYPSILYPGKSQIEPGAKGHKEQGVKYLIDAFSPWSWRKAADNIANSGCNVAILNWWTISWQPSFAYISRRLQKRGVKTIFLCHNLFDHDAKGIKVKFAKLLLKQCDAYIVHSTEQRLLLTKLYPKKPVLQRLHPIYDQFPLPSKKLDQRGKLELLFFGLIRPYKGLDILVKSLARLADKKIYLTIAGEPWTKELDVESTIPANIRSNIELALRYVSDEEAADYFARADVVVLPYRSATGSGVVAVAYHYGKPVIASRVGGLRDAVIESETGWLVKPGSSTQLADLISKLDRKTTAKLATNIKKFCKQNSWQKMAEAISQFANQLVK